MTPEVAAFFDEATNTISYLVADPATNMRAGQLPPPDDTAPATSRSPSIPLHPNPQGGIPP